MRQQSKNRCLGIIPPSWVTWFLQDQEGSLLMAAFAFALHVLGAVIWVAGLHVHLMQAIGWIMIALFAWLFQRPWLAFKRAVDAQDWPSAGTSLDRIRQIISINLPLGLIVVLIGASGRFWG